jgi:hypothetical protein
MKALYADTLTSSEPIYAWVGNHVIHDGLLSYFKKEYVPARKKKKIFAYVIASYHKENKNYQSADKRALRETRMFDDSSLDIQCEINLYGTDKVLI